MIAKPLPTSNPSGAIIAYENLLVSSSFAPAEVALTPNTYERFVASSGAIGLGFRFSEATTINYIAVAGHNLAGQTITFSTAATIGGAQTTVEAITFKDNSPVILTFDDRTVGEVVFAGTLTASIELAVISAGRYLQMPVNIYGGHSPQSLSQETDYQNTDSETGQFLGRRIVRRGTKANLKWQHIDPYWYREYFQPFVQSAVTKPFFIQWRPDRFPDEVEYVYTTGDISPSNMGGGTGLMSVSMSVRGHSDI